MTPQRFRYVVGMTPNIALQWTPTGLGCLGFPQQFVGETLPLLIPRKPSKEGNLHNFYQAFGNSSLAMDVLARRSPSIFATEAYSEMSERYGFVPTAHILEALHDHGFGVRSVQTANVRNKNRVGYAKHLLRLRHRDANCVEVGGSVPEIVLYNSHDGSSAFRLMAGVYRLVCSNGMIVGDSAFDFRIAHRKNAPEKVVEAAYTVLSELPAITTGILDMQRTALLPQEQTALAEASLIVRYGEEEVPVHPTQVLQARRSADNHDDTWSVLNRIQENMVKGGLRPVSGGARTRAINAPDANVKVNRALWSLAAAMVKMKQGVLDPEEILAQVVED